MGKITPPPVVRIDTSEAACTFEEVTEAVIRLGDAFKGIVGSHKKIALRKKPRLCTQCGAPLHGDKCEYCRTEYK